MRLYRKACESLAQATKLLEKEIELMKITGYTLEDLIDLFLRGYTLQPPKTNYIDELSKIAEEGGKEENDKI